MRGTHLCTSSALVPEEGTLTMSTNCEHVTATIGPEGPVKAECEAHASIKVTANGVRWSLCRTHAHVAMTSKVTVR